MSALARASASAGAPLVAAARPASSAPRFVEGHLKCPVPPDQMGWSWRRLRKVEGLSERAVVLTLDVGARLSNLERVLDLLHERKTKVTIFLYTAELEASPRGKAIVRRMADEGHELANHTRSHGDLTKLEPDAVRAELASVETFVRDATGGGTTRPFFREPLLATNDVVDEVIRDECFRSIWFTVDVGDWKEHVTADQIVDNVLLWKGEPRTIASGSIFIFHGSQPENLIALPRVLDRLAADGFSFLTLGEALRRAGATRVAGGAQP